MNKLFMYKYPIFNLPDGVGRSQSISVNSSCCPVSKRTISTLRTWSRWNWKLFRIDNRRSSSMNDWEPTFGTRLKKTIWFSARRVLLSALGFNMCICQSEFECINETRLKIFINPPVLCFCSSCRDSRARRCICCRRLGRFGWQRRLKLGDKRKEKQKFRI